jgi:hypothetical protein
MKSLFIPLKTRWFREFKSGNKHVEWRPHGPRWNAKTLIPGRRAVISHGYRGERFELTVDRFEVVPAENVPDEAREIYPSAVEFAAIHLR